MEDDIITRAELLGHLNRILMVLRMRIKRGVPYYLVVENIELLESLLYDRRDVDWREEKYEESYLRICDELQFIKNRYIS